LYDVDHRLPLTTLALVKFKMADGRHIENRFWLYIGVNYWPINVKFGMEIGDDVSHAVIGHVTKVEIYPNSRWRTAAILKTVFGI